MGSRVIEAKIEARKLKARWAATVKDGDGRLEVPGKYGYRRWIVAVREDYLPHTRQNVVAVTYVTGYPNTWTENYLRDDLVPIMIEDPMVTFEEWLKQVIDYRVGTGAELVLRDVLAKFQNARQLAK